MTKGPDFIGIGVHRAGTTWIYNCLYEHPELYLPIKEINFFADEYRWQKGLNWYKAIFADCPDEKKSGEFSISYFSHPLAPQRISASYPGVKLIVCLRHPVDRAFSHYLFQLKYGFIKNQSFSKALENHPEYLNEGLYAVFLKGYLKYFPPEQILILIYEEVKRDPAFFIEKIYRFIGVDPQYRPSVLYREFNKGGRPIFWPFNRTVMITSALLQSAGLSRLRWFLLKGGAERLIATTIKTRDLNLSPEERKNLSQYFRPSIRELEEIIGKRLPEWHG